jgi:hypothetical protein
MKTPARVGFCSTCGTNKPPPGYRVCDSCRHRARLWYRANKERLSVLNSRQKRLYKYGITPEEYDTLVDKQGGMCAICGVVPSTKQGLCVDHNHTTGKVRGLLCRTCNLGLGHFGDSVQRLQAALQYLT